MLIPRLVASSIAGLLARIGTVLVALIKPKLGNELTRAALQIPELSRWFVGHFPGLPRLL